MEKNGGNGVVRVDDVFTINNNVTKDLAVLAICGK